MGAVGTWHMLRQGRSLSPTVEAPVRGDTPRVEVKLDGGGGISGFEVLVDELIGHGVEVVL